MKPTSRDIDKLQLSNSDRLLMRRCSFYMLDVDQRSRFTPASIVRLWVIFSLLPIAQCIGSYYDNAWILPGDDRGLLEHYGQWTVFFAPPILVMLAATALKKLLISFHCLPAFADGEVLPDSVRQTIKEQCDYLATRGKSKWFLLFLIVLGAMVSLVNFSQTSDSVRAFGNDTFDSSRHFWGFLFTRISNTVLYTVIFPTLIFEIILVTASLGRVLQKMVSAEVLRVDFFNPDECGGMSSFGIINVLIMSFWCVIFIIIFADFIVQKEVAPTLIASAIFCSLLFFAQSIWGVLSIHRCVQKKKGDELSKINRDLNAIMAGGMSLDKLLPLIELRNVVKSTRTLPYTRRSMVVVNAIRFAPSIAPVLHYLLRAGLTP